MRDLVNPAQQVEYTPSLPIYDIREYVPSNHSGVYVVGGFLGELILALSSLYDVVQLNPSLATWKLGTEDLQQLLSEILEEYPEGIINLYFKDDLDKRFEDVDEDDKAR